MSATPRVSVFVAISLDGMIAGPEGNLDWLEPFNSEAEDYGYREFFDSVDALVMGRNTYDVVLGFGTWPYVGKRVVVLTHRSAPSRFGEEFASGPLKPILERLAAAHVYLDGGAAIRQGLREGLVTDITLNVIPVALGDGIRLFAEDLPRSQWIPRLSRTFESGLVQVSYTKSGDS